MPIADIVYNILCGLQFMFAIKVATIIFFLIFVITRHIEDDSDAIGVFTIKLVKYLIYAASITVMLCLF